jgi:threonine aldolase
MLATVKNNPDGTFDLEEMKKAIRSDSIHEPRTMMVAVENSHNYCGGKV